MISKKIEKALNDQINEELKSEYLYLSIAAYFESENLKGFSQWMKAQATEEREHAMKLYSYIFDRGGRVKLQKMDAPKTIWTSVLSAFEDSLKHEKYITKKIHDLVSLSETEKDIATSSFLKWFIDEQVEEEASVDEIVQKLKMIKGAPGGLFMLDNALGTRK